MGVSEAVDAAASTMTAPIGLSPGVAEPVYRAQGVIQSYDDAAMTATVVLVPSGTVIPGVAHLGSYHPVAGDTCWLLQTGPDYLILGAQKNSTSRGNPPAGTVMGWLNDNAPNGGWLLADGSSLLRTAYPDLFAAIGTKWGSADGTHFSLPDFRGYALVGATGTAPMTVGNKGAHPGATVGSSATTLTESALHNHVQFDGNAGSATQATATESATHVHGLNNHVHGINMNVAYVNWVIKT